MATCFKDFRSRNKGLVAGTLVAVENGHRRIEEIESGEKVWSYNQESKKWELREVVDTYALDYEGEIFTLKIGEEEIIATGNHPIWVARGENLVARPRVESELAPHEHALTKEGRWLEARHLQLGDVLSLNGDHYAKLDLISSETRKVAVFNFHVDGNRNYTVSKIGVLVHNSSSMPPGKPDEPPLKRIHNDKTIEADVDNSLDYQRSRSTEDIVDSLKPGSKDPLTTWPDGRIFDGNTRIKVLEDRGFDINSLPRTPKPDTGGFWDD